MRTNRRNGWVIDDDARRATRRTNSVVMMILGVLALTVIVLGQMGAFIQ